MGLDLKESFHPSIWHASDHKDRYPLLLPQAVIQLLKVEIDIKQVSMGLDDFGRTS